MWVLNFILSVCNYSYQITDPSVFSGSVTEAHIRVERCLHESGVLKPAEKLKSFFAREDVQGAFQEASFTWQLRREHRERFVMIMNQE